MRASWIKSTTRCLILYKTSTSYLRGGPSLVATMSGVNVDEILQRGAEFVYGRDKADRRQNQRIVFLWALRQYEQQQRALVEQGIAYLKQKDAAAWTPKDHERHTALLLEQSRLDAIVNYRT